MQGDWGGCFSLKISAAAEDVIGATTAATTIIKSGLAIKPCLFFGYTKNTRA
jgi:hypothetical protein